MKYGKLAFYALCGLGASLIRDAFDRDWYTYEQVKRYYDSCQSFRGLPLDNRMTRKNADRYATEVADRDDFATQLGRTEWHQRKMIRIVRRRERKNPLPKASPLK